MSDPETEALLGPEAEIAAMIDFERALAAAEEPACGMIPPPPRPGSAPRSKGFAPISPAAGGPRPRAMVVVPDLVRQLRAAAGENGASLHFGATSRDVSTPADPG